MEIIQQLRSYDSLTKSEQGIIKTIFQNPDLLTHATAQELAERSYTSASTVVRLCKKLGCKNYGEFRVRMLEGLRKRQHGSTLLDANLPFHEGDSLPEIMQQLTQLQELALEETFEQADEATYRQAVEMLAEADCIHVYGSGINLHLAHDFAYKMARIHRTVQVNLDNQQQLLSANVYRPGDCAIVISYSGEALATVQIVELLHKVGTPYISITSAGENSVAAYAAVRLPIATMERQFSKLGPFSSRTSILAILDYLYAGVFSLDYDHNYELLLASVLSVTDFRASAAPLREDV